MTDKTDWSHDSVSIKNSDNSYFMNFKTKEDYLRFEQDAMDILAAHIAWKWKGEPQEGGFGRWWWHAIGMFYIGMKYLGNALIAYHAVLIVMDLLRWI